MPCCIKGGFQRLTGKSTSLHSGPFLYARTWYLLLTRALPLLCSYSGAKRRYQRWTGRKELSAPLHLLAAGEAGAVVRQKRPTPVRSGWIPQNCLGLESPTPERFGESNRGSFEEVRQSNFNNNNLIKNCEGTDNGQYLTAQYLWTRPRTLECILSPGRLQSAVVVGHSNAGFGFYILEFILSFLPSVSRKYIRAEPFSSETTQS
jgi:hypothetical protein